MRKVIKWDYAGKNYRTKHYSAAQAVEILFADGNTPPEEALSLTEIQLKDGSWAALDTTQAINSLLVDEHNITSPRGLLGIALAKVSRINFDFLKDWKGVDMPRRFSSNVDSVQSDNISPLLGQLVSSGTATLKELEEYYSLQDVFVMLDALTVKAVNDCLAHEEAEEAARAAR